MFGASHVNARKVCIRLKAYDHRVLDNLLEDCKHVDAWALVKGPPVATIHSSGNGFEGASCAKSLEQFSVACVIGRFMSRI